MNWLLPLAAWIVFGIQAEATGTIEGIVMRSGSSEAVARVAITLAPVATEAETAAFHARARNPEIARLRVPGP
jgi:hypothetical protein